MSFRLVTLLLTVMMIAAITACGSSVISLKDSGFITVETGDTIKIAGSSRLESVAKAIVAKSKEPTSPTHNIIPFTFKNLTREDGKITLYTTTKNGELMVGISENVVKNSSGEVLAILMAHAIILSIQGPELEEKDSLLVDVRAVQLIRSIGYNAEKGVEETCQIVDWQRCFFMSLALQTKKEG